ncbi:hypothetical protein B0A55_07086 [Friedmanniomyces simplex]|uniref:GPI-anchor transamidase n=1 Tax=Friedmanniomyces simplex TaxID=329884 RepID=A0A4U0XFJ2_9PEZI|nr:hypothetical protein B0A55_07086 [Friedmanniomyces simplex]
MRLLTLPTALLATLTLTFPPLSDAAHTSNWAVLVSTSRFWFNYRHMANTLSLYRTVKRLGIPDSQIILMLPDDMACNPRNTFAGSVFNDKGKGLDLYDQKKDIESPDGGREGMGGVGAEGEGQSMPTGIEVDYRGNEVTDAEEISSHDLADAFEQMYEKKRYHELLFMIDTCQANTMYMEFYSPGIVATGSSEKDQSSYSHHADQDVGVAVIDRWTYFNLDFLETRLNTMPGVLDFFGNVQGVDVETQVPGDGGGGMGNWRSDLEALRRIAARQEREAMEDMNETQRVGHAGVAVGEEAVERTIVPAADLKGGRDMAASAGGEGWLKKTLGAASLLALGGAWFVGSKLR